MWAKKTMCCIWHLSAAKLIWAVLSTKGVSVIHRFVGLIYRTYSLIDLFLVCFGGFLCFGFCSYYNNAYYAKVGGINTAEMNFLEVDFLFGLSFHLNVTPTTFHTYCCYLQREMLLESPPLNAAIALKSLKLQCSFSEEESAAQKQELTVWLKWVDNQSHSFFFFFLS